MRPRFRRRFDRRRFLTDVIGRANRALSPIGVRLAAPLPKMLPTGGGAFVEIPVTVTFGRKDAPTIETVKIFPVVAEMESDEMRSVFAVSAIEEALKVFGAHRAEQSRALLELAERTRETVVSLDSKAR